MIYKPQNSTGGHHLVVDPWYFFRSDESHGIAMALPWLAWPLAPPAATGSAERRQQLWRATGGASWGRCLRHVAGASGHWNLYTEYHIISCY